MQSGAATPDIGCSAWTACTTSAGWTASARSSTMRPSPSSARERRAFRQIVGTIGSLGGRLYQRRRGQGCRQLQQRWRRLGWRQLRCPQQQRRQLGWRQLRRLERLGCRQLPRGASIRWRLVLTTRGTRGTPSGRSAYRPHRRQPHPPELRSRTSSIDAPRSAGSHAVPTPDRFPSRLPRRARGVRPPYCR
jgi:hypothetical protein